MHYLLICLFNHHKVSQWKHKKLHFDSNKCKHFSNLRKRLVPKPIRKQAQSVYRQINLAKPNLYPMYEKKI